MESHQEEKVTEVIVACRRKPLESDEAVRSETEEKTSRRKVKLAGGISQQTEK